MSYLGRSAKLSLKAQEKVSFLATAGQTVKTGLSYTPTFVEVYVNGVLLTDTTDFTATNGNSITFTVALLLNDEVTVISLKTFTVADHYNKTEADTLLAAKATIANFTSTGIDDNATSTAITIDASENVLVGRSAEPTSANDGTGLWFRPVGAIEANRDGGAVIVANRKTSDGDIAVFRKDGTTVGSIGTRGGNLSIGSGDVSLEFNASNDALLPSSTTTNNTRDAAVDLGISSVRFKDAYLSGGVYLGGTGAANKLDDYEEGSWTPVYSGSSTAGSFSYNYQNGRYTKVGNLVTVVCSLVDISQSSAASGSVHITGLPFSSSNITALNSVGAVNLSRFNLDGKGQIVSIEGNSSYAQFVLMASGAGSGTLLDAGDRVGSSADIFFTLTYRTDS